MGCKAQDYGSDSAAERANCMRSYLPEAGHISIERLTVRLQSAQALRLVVDC